jgi:hypothetical protein
MMKRYTLRDVVEFTATDFQLDASTMVDASLHMHAVEHPKSVASLFEPVLQKLFGWRKSGKHFADALDASGKYIEMRVVSSGISFDAGTNGKFGKTADYNKDKATEKLDAVDYWLLIDVSTFPIVPVYAFTQSQVRKIVETIPVKKPPHLSYSRSQLEQLKAARNCRA